MKISGFEIERFGLWSGLSVPKLFSGINVFYGANEAGKSTLMEFVRAELYGFGGERRRYARRPGGIYASWSDDVDHEGRSLYAVSGGSLDLECPSGNYRLRRMLHPDASGGEEKIDLRTADGSKQGSQLLRVLLSGIDEATFNNVFAIGLDELQKLGSLNDTEAAEMLFRLSVGMDRVSIVDAIKELTARRNRLLHSAEKESKPSRLPKLLRRRDGILGEIADAKLQVREYVQVRAEQQAIDRSVANLEDELAKRRHEKRFYEIVKQSEPIWERRDRLRREIDGMGKVAVVSDETVSKLDEIGREFEKRRQAFDRLKEERCRARDAIEAQPVNETLWKLAPRIEVLLEEEKRIVEIDGQITDLENEISTLEGRVVDEEAKLKRGRRSFPIPVGRPTAPDAAGRPEADSAEKNAAAEKTPTEHASFSASGAVISAPFTSPSIPVSAKGHRPNVESSEWLDAETLEDYRIPARAVNKARRRMLRAKEQHAELLGRSKVLGEKVKTELVRCDARELSDAVEKAGETLTQLRRRQEIGHRLAEMSGHHKELRRINAFLIRHQALPLWMLIALGLFAVVGAILIGLGVFKMMQPESFYAPAPLLIPLGIVVIGGSIAFKFVSEKNSAKKLQHNQRQLGMLMSQLEHAKQEAAAIDARLLASSPASGASSIEVRVREAQQELATLEKLVPVDAQRRETERLLKQTEIRLERFKDEHAAAGRRWTDWLRAAGLPLDWTPARIRDLMDHYDVVGDLKKELDHRYEAMNQRIRDMRMITDRIDRMIVESGLSFEDGISYVDILEEIRKKLEANDEAIRHRDKLKDGIRPFRRMWKKAVSDLRKTRQAESELLRSFGVGTSEELRELNRRHQKHRRLLQQEQSVQRELDAAVGGFCDESAIAELLEPRLAWKRRRRTAEDNPDALDLGGNAFMDDEAELADPPDLDELIDKVDNRIEATSAKWHGELELRGKRSEQLRLMAEDRTILQKQRELAIVEEKIRQAETEWQTYAVCARMLDAIRATYERERQPRTLAEASELLRRLTEGKYHRIWTPLGEETLLVDDEQGNTFDVAWISRGTREQLFIALRLALASAFAQHGSVLPLILDDVLVNFDSKRSLAAAQVLLEFAGSGRQIFLFTCHEHVCRIFQKLDVPVRILPPVDDPGAPAKVLLPRSILRKREKRRRRRAARLAAERTRRLLDEEIARREEEIRLDALRKAEVQRLILQMQQQATAEKTVEAQRETLRSVAAGQTAGTVSTTTETREP